MRVAIYARVSTKDQSCDMQMRDLRAYCAARGFTISREYIDIGQSGAKDSRPELNELMADARKHIDTSSPLGQALFTIVSAVAQLERDLIRERVSAGVRNARASGKQLGRPRRIVSQDEIIRLTGEGASLRQISAARLARASGDSF